MTNQKATAQPEFLKAIKKESIQSQKSEALR